MISIREGGYVKRGSEQSLAPSTRINNQGQPQRAANNFNFRFIFGPENREGGQEASLVIALSGYAFLRQPFGRQKMEKMSSL